MPYQLETTTQLYGEQKYLAHIIKGETPEDDRHLFGERVPSYGIIDIGYTSRNQLKVFKLIDKGIASPILLRSIFVLTGTTNNDEIQFNIIDENGNFVGGQKIISDETPYEFPPVILYPDITISVKPTQNTNKILIYWQPVDVLDYVEVA